MNLEGIDQSLEHDLKHAQLFGLRAVSGLMASLS